MCTPVDLVYLLGISIVGGRVELNSNQAMNNLVSGIFIKSVLKDSPACMPFYRHLGICNS